jgi:Uma2 family endonuclease
MRVYKACPSVQEYVMISTRRQEVEVYHRESANEWKNTLYTAEQVVTFASVDLTIPVSEIYADTRVPPLASVLDTD